MTDNNLADHMHQEMTGEEFCKLFPNLSKRLVKLTNESECHNRFQFKTGLNEDTVSFNPIDECQAGGIYFTDIDNLSKWLKYGNCAMKYYRKVTLPPDCRVYIEENKFKANKIILDERVEIEKIDCWSDKEYLKALNYCQIRFSLQYIKNVNAFLVMIDLLQMLENQVNISEKAIRYALSKDIYYHSVEWSAKYSEAIMYASEYGYLDVVKFLLSDEFSAIYPNIDPSANDNEAIRYASEFGHIEVVKFLLSDKISAKYPNIDPSADNNYAISLASRCGHIDVVKVLLSDEIRTKYPNVDPSAEDNEAIRGASVRGHLEVVKYLLSNEIREKYPNIDPSANNNQAIREASKRGHMEIVKLLSQDQRVIKQGIPQTLQI